MGLFASQGSPLMKGSQARWSPERLLGKHKEGLFLESPGFGLTLLSPLCAGSGAKAALPGEKGMQIPQSKSLSYTHSCKEQQQFRRPGPGAVLGSLVQSGLVRVGGGIETPPGSLQLGSVFTTEFAWVRAATLQSPVRVPASSPLLCVAGTSGGPSPGSLGCSERSCCVSRSPGNGGGLTCHGCRGKLWEGIGGVAAPVGFSLGPHYRAKVSIPAPPSPGLDAALN